MTGRGRSGGADECGDEVEGQVKSQNGWMRGGESVAH